MDVLGSKHLAHCLYRKEIFIAAQSLLPPVATVNASSRNYAVEMGMQRQVLTPGMQYRYHSQPDIAVAAKQIQCSPRSFKKRVVNKFRHAQCKIVKPGWKSKNNMIIGAWKQVLRSTVYPLYALMSLAFGAMPVPATIIADNDGTALITCINMTSQSCSAA
jgi:hypothetical protein